MVHLIPSHVNYNATQLAELVFENIYKIHGLPQNIISDRDVLFTSTFWSRLHRLIGTKLQLSSAYHPQSDGSTERANWTVTQMLRQCINSDQKDWVSKLPAIEFASTYHSPLHSCRNDRNAIKFHRNSCIPAGIQPESAGMQINSTGIAIFLQESNRNPLE